MIGNRIIPTAIAKNVMIRNATRSMETVLVIDEKIPLMIVIVAKSKDIDTSIKNGKEI
jgi:hypothetical protein